MFQCSTVKQMLLSSYQQQRILLYQQNWDLCLFGNNKKEELFLQSFWNSAKFSQLTQKPVDSWIKMRAVLIQTMVSPCSRLYEKAERLERPFGLFCGWPAKTAVLHFSGLVIVLKVNVSFLCCPSNTASRKNYGVEEQSKDNFKLICK